MRSLPLVPWITSSPGPPMKTLSQMTGQGTSGSGTGFGCRDHAEAGAGDEHTEGADAGEDGRESSCVTRSWWIFLFVVWFERTVPPRS